MISLVSLKCFLAMIRSLTSNQAFKYGLIKEISGKDDVAARRSRASDAIYRDAPEPRDSVASDAARGAGKGMGRILGRGFRSPLDFTMGISKGFRNIPKMYGDNTTREVDQVTGFHSGLRTAGKVCARFVLSELVFR